MKLCSQNRGTSGVSLVEVVIAVCVVGLVSAGLMGAISCGFTMLSRTRENQRATQVMLEKVETLRLYSWSQINSNGFVPAKFEVLVNPLEAGNKKAAVMAGTITVEKFPFAASYSNDLKQVRMTLEWRGAGNVKRMRSLTTFISKDGMQNYVY
jgi:hypothetical protein